MYRRTSKFALEENEVLEMIDGNWVRIAVFYDSKGGSVSAETSALRFYESLVS